MVEELQVIKDIFNNATNSALIAYGMYLLAPIVKTALIIFPVISAIKFVVTKVKIDD